ncbi:MAG: trehalase family glycosidase [Planctomycetota bacterium]|nr:trehalase family glycosidase [Planctomycetota bacterium]
MTDYRALTDRLARGWNTWYVKNMLAHVLLPEGMVINLGLKEYRGGQHLREILKGPVDVVPGLRSYDGAYTDLTLSWHDVRLRVQTALDGDDWVALVTPLGMQKRRGLIVAECGMLWNRPGSWRREGDVLRGQAGQRRVDLFSTAAPAEEASIWALSPYLPLPLDGPVGLSTGRARSVADIEAVLARQRTAEEQRVARYGDLAEVYRAARAALAWNTIYDPVKGRVITPVARTWCSNHGWVLFEWDTYFAAYMLAVDNPDLAMANAIAITNEITPEGLVPNFAQATGFTSRDRSEPPVGAWVCREIYRGHRTRWFLEEVYPNLLRWNRWWWQARRNGKALLSWGSTPYEPVFDAYWEVNGVNERFGASLESGLDNSPMYDDVPFDNVRHVLQMWDVGLNGLYVADCEALADIAGVLGHDADAAELRRRAATVRAAMSAQLWDEPFGLFLNRRVDTGELSRRISPTNFYSLLARAATPAQADRMIREHFYNPEEFWGEWVLPSIARNDVAYPEQSYWRGRIWGPMNFLAYISLRVYGLPGPRRDLAENSKALLLKSWLSHGHVLENYNAETGDNTVAQGKMGGDSFYYWGGLLGTIALMEAGHYPAPEAPLTD